MALHLGVIRKVLCQFEWCSFLFSYRDRKMRIVFVKFREITQKYPIVRGMVSYAAIWPAGCLLQQKITGKKEFNYVEAIRFSLYGSLYVAPTLYCWLRFASYLWPKSDLKSAITKVCLKRRHLKYFIPLDVAIKIFEYIYINMITSKPLTNK